MKILSFNEFLNEHHKHDYESPVLERFEFSDFDDSKYKIIYQHTGKSNEYTLLDSSNNILGTIRTESGHIEGVAAEKGYGPFMYEIAMQHNYPTWFSPGSGSTTDDAYKIWQKMLERSDVESVFADDVQRETDNKSKLSSMKFRMKPSEDFKKIKFVELSPDDRIALNKKIGPYFTKKYTQSIKKALPRIPKDFKFDLEQDF